MKAVWGNRGTTLVEILLALALSSVLMSGLVSIYWSCSYIFTEQAAYIDSQYSVRSSVQQMGEDIRRASIVEILANGAELRLGLASGESLRYYLYNNQLFREGITQQGTARVPIAENISYLRFSGTASLVTISIDATMAGKSHRLSTCVHSRLADLGG